jgi:hypothetical protein
MAGAQLPVKAAFLASLPNGRRSPVGVNTMREAGTSVLWGATIVAKEQLDGRRWIYAVEAPFDMASDIPDLIGLKESLGGREYEIRGSIPKLPRASAAKGELIELLVVSSSA